MSLENPTPLKVGATGTLDGKRWRVAGRVVLSVQLDDGETYYWNEFNLVDGFGRRAILVFEETESGPQWKLFKMLEPLHAMTADEAATKQVGDTVNLDGTPARITLVDQSQVVHIEGVGPDGVEVGDVAHYFNVESGPRMLVASWSGEDIEFYEGNNLPGQQVAAAFGLLRSNAAFALARTTSLDGGQSAPGWSMKLVGVVLGGVVLFGFFSCGVCGRQAQTVPPLAKRAAPPVRVTVGAHGVLAQNNYAVASHALLEIDRVGARHDRHEYALAGDGAEPALLINGLTGAINEWHLFESVTDAPGVSDLSPFDAATRRRGAPLRLGARTLHITELFQSKRLSVDGPGAAAVWPALHYGFVARDADDWLIVRWTESGLQVYRGRAIAEAEVLKALGTGAKSP